MISKSFLRRNRENETIWSQNYKNLSEDGKQKLVKCRKKYYKMRKNYLL